MKGVVQGSSEVPRPRKFERERHEHKQRTPTNPLDAGISVTETNGGNARWVENLLATNMGRGVQASGCPSDKQASLVAIPQDY